MEDFNKFLGKVTKALQGNTSEIIYYWMIRLGMNVELFEKWHLNRLMALIRVFDAKESPKKKQSKKELMASRRAINEARKKKYHTRG